MITVRKTEDGFERVIGNPIITSLDGTRKAPLKVILHPSWSAADRAEYGIFQATPVAIPEGKRPAAGKPTYQQQRDEIVVEVVELEDIPIAQPVRLAKNQRLRRFFEEAGITPQELMEALDVERSLDSET